jgi:predicted alpha/beta hydrolase family esterase
LKFNATILILPGLGNSGDKHWQTLWEGKFPEFIRVHQTDWETPECEDWIAVIDDEIIRHDPENVIVVGHSLACATIVFWHKKFKRQLKGALLVAPSDTEAPSYPKGTSGFTPMPLSKLSFPSIAVVSNNDYYVSRERAEVFANRWGSEIIEIGKAGHINTDSGYGEWEEGLLLLQKLDGY